MQIDTRLGEVLIEQTLMFAKADFEHLAPTLAVPTTIRVHEKQMVLTSQDEISEMFRVFRQNLMIEGYERTQVQIYDQALGEDGRCQTLLRWTNLNKRGGKINTMDACCFSSRGRDGVWRTELIEVICDGGTHLSSGMPLH
jgi:hypothetical protein